MKQSLRYLLLVANFYLVISCSDSPPAKNADNDLNINDMSSERDIFGTINKDTVYLYTLRNIHKMQVQVTNYGGIITSLIVPDKSGKLEDVVLGFDELKSYQQEHPYFGSLIGRYGNRIARGEFELEGTTYTLAKNNGNNHLHGGISGFNRKLWHAESFQSAAGVGVKLTYKSPDMEEGYPGNMQVTVEYLLTNDNELKINYQATTDKACPVNLTHHGYFNLTGMKENILGQELKINARSFVEVNDELIPTGNLPAVDNTPMDFTEFHKIGERIAQVEGGYDHAYVLNQVNEKPALAAELYDSASGRLMQVYTTEPALQFYTGNFLDGSLTGKNGVPYTKHFGLCLEAQHYPDSPNQQGFPNTILRPGEIYQQQTIYKFSIK